MLRSGLELVGQYVMLMQVLTKVEVQGGVCVCVCLGVQLWNMRAQPKSLSIYVLK